MSENTVNTKPLTADKLKKLPALEWVWIKFLKPSVIEGYDSAYYRKQEDDLSGKTFKCKYSGVPVSFDYADYNKTWVAYLFQPKTV